MKDAMLQIPIEHRVAFGRMIFRDAIRKYPASRKILEKICKQFAPEGVTREISVSFQNHPIYLCSFGIWFSISLILFMGYIMYHEFPSDLTVIALLYGEFPVSRFLANMVMYFMILGVMVITIAHLIYGFYIPIVMERIACKMLTAGLMIPKGMLWPGWKIEEQWIDWMDIHEFTPIVRTFKGNTQHSLVIDVSGRFWPRISIEVDFVLWYSTKDMKIVGECFKKLQRLARQCKHGLPLSMPDICDLDEDLNLQNMGE